MDVKWTSFPYRAEFADPALEFAERSAGTAPEQMCQTERHMLTTIPAVTVICRVCGQRFRCLEGSVACEAEVCNGCAGADE